MTWCEFCIVLDRESLMSHLYGCPDTPEKELITLFSYARNNNV